MAATHGAKHLGPGITQQIIDGSFDVFGFRRIIKGRPSASGIELFLGRKQLGITTGAKISARALFLKFIIDFPVGSFRARFSKDSVLFGR